VTQSRLAAAAAGTPPWLDESMGRVEKVLLETAGSSPHPLVSEPALHLIKAGGKRMRPALVLLSSHAGRPHERATDLAAAAIELVHIATLYHDDVIDQTETRRGVVTVHNKWGTDVAVLAGDFLFACGSELGAQASGEVPGILARAIAEVCQGQILETGALGDPRRSVSTYVEVIERKTAALFRAACELGTATSGAPPSLRSAVVEYGANLGLAFQIVDDLLDLVGDPSITGKEPGTDLREGVFTAPVLFACEMDPSLATRLEAGDTDLNLVLQRIVATGALQQANALATMHAERARACLKDIDGTDWGLALTSLIDRVLAQVPPLPAA
jgi:geranylgeranyl pyrophosphate synthase